MIESVTNTLCMHPLPMRFDDSITFCGHTTAHMGLLTIFEKSDQIFETHEENFQIMNIYNYTSIELYKCA